MSEETPPKFLAHNDSAVIKHMEMYQVIISRMASNSAACKTWAIPLITALLAFAVQAKLPALVWIGILPVIIFYVLDSYYLMLENQFREASNLAAEKIAHNKFSQTELFQFVPKGSSAMFWKKSFRSLATWPIYLTLIVMILVTVMFA